MHTRKVFLSIILLGLFTVHLSAQGFLKAKGKIIVNERGEKYILRGMGLGGWMLQEGYMFRLGALGRQYVIKDKIRELVGEEKTKQFYIDWLSSHTTKKDIDSMARWGFNSIRLPMHYNLYTLPVDQEPVAGKNTWIEKGFAMTDSLLSWCKQNKMYLILDLHAAPGGQGNDLPISDRDPAKPSLWQSEANKQKMIALWQQLAKRYANEPWIGGYDIINEPNWGFEDEKKDFRGTEEKVNAPLQQLLKDLTKAIREVDKKHIIIIEGNGFGNNYNGITPDWDDNLVMSFHKYGNFNNVGSISRFLQLRDKFNIPLWLGESGENSNTWFTEAISLAENNDIGWAWWQGKKMGINNPLEIRQPEDYTKLVDWMTGKSTEKPSEAEAWKILQDLLHNVRIENNIYHPDVVDAMFRQVHQSGTVPFKHLVIDKTQATIDAVDFDMGSQRVAYYDKDTARYQYTPGVNTVGNRGGAYRNDGVDIDRDLNTFHVFNIEPDEWLQYTIDVQEGGNYKMTFMVSSDSSSRGALTVWVDGKTSEGTPVFPIAGGKFNWQTIEGETVHLSRGVHRLRIAFKLGGFRLKQIGLGKLPD
jgi:endoglucanase